MPIKALRIVLAVGLALWIVTTGAAMTAPAPVGNVVTKTDDVASVDRITTAAQFRALNPLSDFGRDRNGVITKIFGSALERGATAVESSEAFRMRSAELLGAKSEELVPVQVEDRADNAVPVMYDHATGEYRFTAFRYKQQRGGIDVFKSSVAMLVRNGPGQPLVLVNAQVRDLGAFAVEPGSDRKAPSAVAMRKALEHAAAIAELEDGEQEVVLQSRKVIFAGVDEVRSTPRLADEFLIGRGAEKWLIVVDAMSGAVLYDESMICRVDLTGVVTGRATQGIAADFCELEPTSLLPYIEVDAGGTIVYCSDDGSFVVPNAPQTSTTVTAKLRGRWFEVFNFAGADSIATRTVTPPNPAILQFNAVNNNEFIRAEVNGYLYANKARDFVIQQNPLFPTLGASGFPVNVNREDGFCPGNAWYDVATPQLNFCRAGTDQGSGQSFPNTAWSSIIYHEFGHHLVQTAGSGQGQYGEGYGDALATIILDTPMLGLGYYNNCSAPLRSADNVLQTPCSGSIHHCGQVLSGCIWDARELMVLTEPVDYKNILGALLVNSVLVHVGSLVEPELTIDFLTLDDDNGNIFDGTPHYNEITGGFSQHGMVVPVLDPIGINFPDGLPEYSLPSGESTIRVKVISISGLPAVGQAWVNFDINGVEQTAMLAPTGNAHEYFATIPSAACGTRIDYSFFAQATNGIIINAPYNTNDFFTTHSAYGSFLSASDNFENENGWVSDPLDAADGMWERGVPVADISWANAPNADSDGSGQCWVTGNRLGNSDVDDGFVQLTSPVYDMSAGPTILAYDYYLRLSNQNGVDRLAVEMTDGIHPWVEVARHDMDSGFRWLEHRITPGDMADAGLIQTATMQVRFIVNDLTPQSIVEAGLDNIRVELLQCSPPNELPEDLTGDGVVNVSDLFLLLSLWGNCGQPCPPSCAAELTGDCKVDVNDLFRLLAAWTD